MKTFPEHFLWGAATAAYQVEGGIESNDWHVFTTDPVIVEHVRWIGEQATPPERFDLRPAGEAVGHGSLDQLREDLDRCQMLGLNAYRFSVEWSRVEPRRGQFTNALEDYYVEVVRELVTRGMEPIVTLSHLSLPRWVLTPPNETRLYSLSDSSRQYRNSLRGWDSAETVDAWVRFVEQVVPPLAGAGTRWWVTLNEPVGSVVGVGYLAGVWPPGFTGDGDKAKNVYFNLLRAHVRAFHAIKAVDPGAMVSIAQNVSSCKVSPQPDPPTGSHARARDQFDYFYHWHMIDALTSGRVDVNLAHEERKRDYRTCDEFFDIEQSRWRPTLDYVGVNYYRAVYVRHDERLALVAPFAGGMPDPLDERSSNLVNDLRWEMYPDGLGNILRKIRDDYGLPVVITENGVPETVDGTRAGYVVAHLVQIEQALADGVDVRGYLYWSIVDNFEWAYNYTPNARFGAFTVNRYEIDARGHFRRQLTEGGAALRRVVIDGSTERALAAFGAVAHDGSSMEAPAESPGARYTGAVDGTDAFAIVLSTTPTGFDAFICYSDEDRPISCSGVTWESPTRTLSFAHPALGQVPARRFSGRVDNDTIVGQCAEGPTSRVWRANRSSTFGQWIDPVSGVRYAALNWEATDAGWYIKVLRHDWQRAFSFAIRSESMSFTSTLGNVAGTVDGARLSGPGVQAVRLGDGLPFTPIEPITSRHALVTIEPSHVRLGARTEFIVRVVDADSGVPVPGDVYADGQRIAGTNVSFHHVFAQPAHLPTLGRGRNRDPIDPVVPEFRVVPWGRPEVTIGLDVDTQPSQPIPAPLLKLVPTGPFPIGLPSELAVLATDPRTGAELTGHIFLDGQLIGTTGSIPLLRVTFPHPNSALIAKVAGYPDASHVVEVFQPTLKAWAEVDPAIRAGQPASITIRAQDARTLLDVGGQGTITNPGPRGTSASFTTNTPFRFVLRNTVALPRGGVDTAPAIAVIRIPPYREARVEVSEL